MEEVGTGNGATARLPLRDGDGITEVYAMLPGASGTENKRQAHQILSHSRGTKAIVPGASFNGHVIPSSWGSL